MPEHIIAIGCDCSKGRIDVEVRNNHGTVLHTGVYDDTPDGQLTLSRVVDGLREKQTDVKFLVGLESTGGMERNWLSYFRREKRWVKQMRVFRLNAASVHAYRKAQLHRAPGDAAAARDIARFLLEKCTDRTPHQEPEPGPVVFYRTIRSMLMQLTAISQRIQTLLVAANPELVRYCRYGLSNWIVQLLERYPTAIQLGRAHVSTVDAIPHIDAERAAELIANAKRSVASLTDDASAAAIRLLVCDWQETNHRIERAQQELLDIINKNPESKLSKAIALLDGIPGIAPWSAACLASEIGDPTRFSHSKAIIAWAGLDPITEASGDEQHNCGISHRGNAHIRAVLFPLAMAGIMHNPVLKAFHQRLVNSNGKTHLEALVAVMAKLLRMAHAILLTGKAFDVEHETKRSTQATVAQKIRNEDSPSPITPVPANLDAPISRREANRRKQAATPGSGSAGSRSQARSRGRTAGASSQPRSASQGLAEPPPQAYFGPVNEAPPQAARSALDAEHDGQADRRAKGPEHLRIT